MITVKVENKYVQIKPDLRLQGKNIKHYRIYSKGFPQELEEMVSIKLERKDHTGGIMKEPEVKGEKPEHRDYQLIGFKMATFVRNGKEVKALLLSHLKSPDVGDGYGRLGLAMFWAILELWSLDWFALRFGGGRNSEQFLTKLGFPKKHMNKVRDKNTVGNYSIVLGNVRRPRRNDNLSDIQPIPKTKENFPADFFEYEIS